MQLICINASKPPNSTYAIALPDSSFFAVRHILFSRSPMPLHSLPLFFLLHLLEGGEGFFHDGVDAGGDLFVGHVYFAAGRRLDAELGYISKRIGDFA